MIKEIIIRIANKTSVYKNILKTSVSPRAVNPVIHTLGPQVLYFRGTQ